MATDLPAKPDLTNVPAEATDEERLRALVETISSYIDYYHGGSVKMIGFEAGTLQIEMSGACLGCPLSAETLHGWVEGTVKQFFPQVTNVVSVN